MDMFEDAATALDHDRRHHRRHCAYSQWLRTLETEDQVGAEELMGAQEVTSRSLARYFTSKGAVLNDQVLNRHRKGHCCGQGN